MAEVGQPDVFCFIINPRAGRRDGSHLTGRIETVFAQAPGQPSCRILLTERPGHATELAAELAATYGNRAVIFACGGDGTAREVAAGVAGTEAAMGIVPIGTANDLARTALSTREVDKLLPMLPFPKIRPIDAVKIDNETCINITSLGFDTKVQIKAAQLNRRLRFLGSSVYPLAILQSLFGRRSYRMRYTIETVQPDGSHQEVSGTSSFILAAICNGRFYGGGYNPAPQALLDDGKLTFCLVDDLPLRRIIQLLPKYKQGTHLGDPAIHQWQVVSGELEAAGTPLLGNYDGDAFSCDRLSFQIMPGAVRFAFY
ncbi:MAG: hypothetical protein GX112_01105 [Clostridiaceae bacterium]|nr:hypothetical protein [Clostridiaceae bacterium]